MTNIEKSQGKSSNNLSNYSLTFCKSLNRYTYTKRYIIFKLKVFPFKYI